MITTIETIYSCFLAANQSICTDTRKDVEGSFFVCLTGENHDANLKAESAKKAGAKYVLTNRKDLEGKSGFIIVKDPLLTLQNLATHHRNELGLPVIAIGGSNGKTTTKELLFAIFKTTYNTHVTPGNFNNHIGVPLTLLQLRKKHEVAIVELGINHPSEMTQLCKIALPNEGLLTNIGKEHLEGFGSLEGVAKAESELFDYLLKTNGLCYINTDDTWLMNMSKRLPHKVTYGINLLADFDINFEALNPAISFELGGVKVSSLLSGDYNFSNILAAIAVAKKHDITDENIAKGIKSYVPKNNRSQWADTKRNKVLIDCYNANPTSMELAIINLDQMEAEPKYFFIGDMLEMGNHAETEHKNILELALKISNKSKIFVFVGDEFSKQGSKYPFTFFTNTDECNSWLEKMAPIENSLILLKASRGIKLESILINL
jgi:UDP-N-acetylmuramoyl-tripeptide--D-alanyl-D-alanine ligase